MIRQRPWGGWLLLALTVASSSFAQEPPRLELQDGDRVVLVGNAFFELELPYGYLETALTTPYPDRAITVRNLGWSGDNVFGDARAGFGTTADGFKKLKQDVLAEKPTILFIAYGMNESFEGPAGLSKFTQGLITLLDTLAETKVKIVLASPIRHENLGPPLPDPSKHNQSIAQYVQTMRDVAKVRGCVFVDLFKSNPLDEAKPHRTTDGIHLNAYGYWHVAQELHQGLGWTEPAWKVSLDAQGAVHEHVGVRLNKVKSTNQGLRFQCSDVTLPTASTPLGPPTSILPSPRILKISDLKPGHYQLKVDGKDIVSTSADAWAQGVSLPPEAFGLQQVEQLRQAIVEKNRLFFYRWRPQNETYLYGFRKHEQGRNASEVPQFDPLIAELEAKIAKLRVPQNHSYELTREGEVSK